MYRRDKLRQTDASEVFIALFIWEQFVWIFIDKTFVCICLLNKQNIWGLFMKKLSSVAAEDAKKNDLINKNLITSQNYNYI